MGISAVCRKDDVRSLYCSVNLDTLSEAACPEAGQGFTLNSRGKRHVGIELHKAHVGSMCQLNDQSRSWKASKTEQIVPLIRMLAVVL